MKVIKHLDVNFKKTYAVMEEYHSLKASSYKKENARNDITLFLSHSFLSQSLAPALYPSLLLQALQPSLQPLLFTTHTWFCILHVLLTFPSTGYFAFPFSTVISLVGHQILQVPVLICPLFHQQVTASFSSLTIPAHSAQAALLCFF